MCLLQSLLNCPNRQMGFFTTKFPADFDSPPFCPPLAPDESTTPLGIHSGIYSPLRKGDGSYNRYAAACCCDLATLKHIREFSDNTRTKTATTAYVISAAFNVEPAGRRHVFASSTMVTMAPGLLGMLDHRCPVVIMTDVRSEPLQLANLHQTGYLSGKLDNFAGLRKMKDGLLLSSGLRRIVNVLMLWLHLPLGKLLLFF